jgi:hypothetical protein
MIIDPLYCIGIRPCPVNDQQRGQQKRRQK